MSGISRGTVRLATDIFVRHGIGFQWPWPIQFHVPFSAAADVTDTPGLARIRRIANHGAFRGLPRADDGGVCHKGKRTRVIRRDS
jgi:hypothetical protein